MARLLKRERKRAERVLHLDSGDCFQGAPIFNLNNGEAEFSFLSRMRPGRGGDRQPRVRRRRCSTSWRRRATTPPSRCWRPTTSGTAPTSPATTQAALNTAPYTIRNVQGLRVGIIGMANISSLNSLVGGRQLAAGHPAGAERGGARLRGAAAPGGGPARRRQPPGPHRGPGSHPAATRPTTSTSAPSPSWSARTTRGS